MELSLGHEKRDREKYVEEIKDIISLCLPECV